MSKTNTHSFDIDEANQYGIECALLLNYIRHFCDWAKRNDRNNHDGFYWTYDSATSLQDKFNYMTKRSISRYLKDLVEQGIILKGNYNKSKMDNTNWYTIPSEFASEVQENTTGQNGACMGQNDSCMGQNDSTIPIQSSIQSLNIPIVPLKDEGIITIVENVYSAYPSKCVVRGAPLGKGSKDKTKIKSLLKTTTEEKLLAQIKYYVEQCKLHKTYMKNFSTFLNNLPEINNEEIIEESRTALNPSSHVSHSGSLSFRYHNETNGKTYFSHQVELIEGKYYAKNE